MSDSKIGRREFLSRSALIGAAGIVGISACSNKEKLVPLRQPGEYYIPELPDKAINGRELKVGVVGCGGRGSGAIINLLDAADGIVVTALGDTFADRIDNLRKRLKENKNIEVPDENCFVGFDAYKKVIDMVDVVILTTPPVFRPDQFKYAVEKGVHSFLEKPIAVDPKGYRTCIAAAKQAKSKGLVVVTGVQRHHQRPYVQANQKIQEGLIGTIVGGSSYWNQSQLWYRERQKEWSDMEWMIRDWVNWTWLSGDHIVEQHVHNIDIFLWMSGLTPKAAKATGARHRRVTGDQYDEFSVDFEFENGVHLQSMCRQIDGCSGTVHEEIRGTKGWWTSEDHKIRDYKGNILWEYDEEADKAQFQQHNPYVLEHVDLVNLIRKGIAHDEATYTAESTLAGILGREAAYTGQTITWEDIKASSLDLMPEKLEIGPMDMSKYTVKVPGSDNK